MGNCSTCTCNDKNEVSTFEVQVGNGDITSTKDQRASNAYTNTKKMAAIVGNNTNGNNRVRIY